MQINCNNANICAFILLTAYEHMIVNFQERLKRAKAKSRYTAAEMAAMLGVSKRSYDYYEAGEKLPAAANMESINQKLTAFEALHSVAQHYAPSDGGRDEISDRMILRLVEQITELEEDYEKLKELIQKQAGQIELLQMQLANKVDRPTSAKQTTLIKTK